MKAGTVADSRVTPRLLGPQSTGVIKISKSVVLQEMGFGAALGAKL